MSNKNCQRLTSSKIIIMAAMIILNMLGISYAYLNNGLFMMMNVITGSLSVVIDSQILADEGLTVRFEDHNRVLIIEGSVDMPVVQTISETDEVIIIQSECVAYEGLISFQLRNNGTTNANLTGQSLIGSIMTFEPANFPTKLAPGEISQPQEIRITAQEGTYDFEVQLQYSN